ncbi:hypothetical protein D3C71_1472420 [compost metagenome]
MIGLLIDHDRIQPQGLELGIFRLRQRLHLHRQGAEVAADLRQVLAKIGHAHLALVLAGHQQHAVKATRLEGQTLALDFLGIQGLALEAVAHGEAAVGAVVGAEVRQIERYVEADRVAETLAGEALRQLRHLRQEGLGGRGDQRHEVIQAAPWVGQRQLHVPRRLGADAHAHMIPVQLAPAVDKGRLLSPHPQPLSQRERGAITRAHLGWCERLEVTHRSSLMTHSAPRKSVSGLEAWAWLPRAPRPAS